MAEDNIYSYYSAIRPKEVSWIWYPYIPSGKITLIQGDPGEGKSTFITQLIAIITNTGIYPDGTTAPDKGVVIYQCDEDGKEDTILPRLIDAGADCDKVVFIDDTDRPITLSDSRIDEVIKKTNARLLVLDPIQAFIPNDVDMLSVTGMRGVMRKLALIAEKNDCAIILVSHMNKSTGGKKLYRGLGSIDIAAIARSILMVTRDEAIQEKRYVYPIKSSLAPIGDAISFALDPESGFKWLGTSSYIPSDEKNIRSIDGKKTQAKEYLAALLADKDIPTNEVLEYMKKFNISERTVKNAQKELNIQAYRKKKTWYLHLEKEQE